MPSYRVRMVVSVLRPGVEPADVLPAAAAAARERTVVESSELEIRKGLPILTVRFEAPDDLTASQVGSAVVHQVDAMVDVEVSRVTRRYGTRWYGLR